MQARAGGLPAILRFSTALLFAAVVSHLPAVAFYSSAIYYHVMCMWKESTSMDLVVLHWRSDTSFSGAGDLASLPPVSFHYDFATCVIFAFLIPFCSTHEGGCVLNPNNVRCGSHTLGQCLRTTSSAKSPSVSRTAAVPAVFSCLYM